MIIKITIKSSANNKYPSNKNIMLYIMGINTFLM